MKTSRLFLTFAFAAVAGIVGCSVEVTTTAPASLVVTGSSDKTSSGTATGTASKLAGEISINGSSTVFLIADAAQEAFKELHPGVQIGLGEGP